MPAEQTPPAILWFRKDLRLDDNKALHAAIDQGGGVISVYIREPKAPNVGPLGGAQEWWLHHSLQALQASLRKLGSDLFLLSGSPAEVLADLATKTGASTVFIKPSTPAADWVWPKLVFADATAHGPSVP